MKLIFLLLLLTALPCFARLGETEAQCIARYGQPDMREPAISEGSDQVKEDVFLKNGMRFAALFLNDKCCSICFYKADDEPFDATEARFILDANADGQAWTPTATPNEYVRADGAKAFSLSKLIGVRFDDPYERATLLQYIHRARSIATGL